MTFLDLVEEAGRILNSFQENYSEISALTQMLVNNEQG